MAMDALKKSRKQKPSKLTPAKKKWLKAVKLVEDRGDPWQKFNLGKIKTEKGRRHRRDQEKKFTNQLCLSAGTTQSLRSGWWMSAS